MTNFSETQFEVGEKTYTLFLNRQGIVAWEKYSKEEFAKAQAMKDKYKDILNKGNLEITDETNPFEDIEDMENDLDMTRKMYIKLYWIMLYTKEKLSLSQVTEIWNEAEQIYGLEQLAQLANQMVEDANKDLVTKQEIKKLKALNQKK